jgi:hypothetical protein
MRDLIDSASARRPQAGQRGADSGLSEPGKRTLTEQLVNDARARTPVTTLATPASEATAASEVTAPAVAAGVDHPSAARLHGEAAPIARSLGLGLPRIELGGTGAAIARGRGARGIALGDATFLDPARLDAGSSETREVLAHELIHQAQARLPPSADHGREAAEAEAHEIAAHYAATGELAQPRLAIDLSQPAADNDARKPGVTAAMYLYVHASKFLRAVHAHLTGIEPALPGGLSWRDYPRFVDLFTRGLAGRTGDLDVAKTTTLRELVHPANVHAAIDSGRIMLGFDKDGAAKHPGDPRYGSLGLRDWSDSAGRAFSHVIESALRQSVTRMGARYLAAAQRKGQHGSPAHNGWSFVDADELVMSHPMDSLVTPALPAFGVLVIDLMHGNGRASPSTPEAAGKTERGTRTKDHGADSDAPRTRNGLRALDATKFEWQGAKDPKLWNWVKVSEPDATAEEVAEAIWGSGAGDKSIYAYGITAMPPYFGFPRSWARRMPGVGQHAPAADADQDERPHDNAVALANSPLADEVALLQAGGSGPAGPPLSSSEIGALIHQMKAQLAHIEPIATAWGEGGAIAGARAFVDGKAQLLAAEPAKAGMWSNALRQQQQVLYDVATQLDQMHGQLGATGRIDPNDPQAAPYRDVVAAYTRAAATSHLAVTSRALIASAKEQQRMLAARIVTDAARDAEINVQDMRGVTPDSDADRREMTARSGSLTDGAAKLQTDLLAGRAPDADQVDEMLVTAEEVALKARMRALVAKLAIVEKAAASANDGFLERAANLFDGDIWSLPGQAGVLGAKLQTIRARLDESIANARIIALGEPNQAKMLREGRRIAVKHARGALDALQKDTNIERFLKLSTVI